MNKCDCKNCKSTWDTKTIPLNCPYCTSTKIGILLNYCGHKETIKKEELDCHPYGDNCRWDECLECGEKLNFEVF